VRYAFILTSLVALASSVSAADWQAVTTELLQKEKPGYGGLCGVAVDHATGHVYVNVSDRGVFRSTDQGKTWERLGKEIKGRTETPTCLQLDPTGKTKRLMMATVYGGPIILGSTDKGEWRTLDKTSGHVDWSVADWSDPDLKFILTLKHESGGLLLLSRDGGKTFDEIGKGYGPAWVFDADTAVATLAKSKDRPKGSLVRTTDGGKTFKPVADYAPVSMPRLHGDTLYWLADGALIKTTNKGETWEKVSDLKDGRFGPVFGKDAKHMFVLTGAGVVESTDGGATWGKPIVIPKELKGVSPLTWLEYDPINDVLYVMKMTSELYKMPRSAK
jgi:photosystem II stability/assembly factor-like uncharacterized protein